MANCWDQGQNAFEQPQYLMIGGVCPGKTTAYWKNRQKFIPASNHSEVGMSENGVYHGIPPIIAI